MKIVFATSNPNKLREVQNLTEGIVSIVSLREIGFHDELPETSKTIEGNALQKARTLASATGLDCFADDTGLEVDFLNGEPGVYSARYAGPDCDSNANMDKLLKELGDTENRNAKFKTVIALILGGKEYLFTGIAEGEITRSKTGTDGFGYDPLFLPAGYPQTFGQMTLAEKNKISHRAKALKQLVEFLKSL